MTDATAALTEENEGHTLTMTRRFAAPRERVFAAWTDRALVAQWFGPENVTCTIHEWDAREGGAYSLTMHDSDGDDMPLSGVFREVSPPERLVVTWVWGSGDMAGRETVLALEFEEAGGDTVLHLSHSLLPDKDWAEKHSMGWGSCFNSLDATLAAAKTTSPAP